MKKTVYLLTALAIFGITFSSCKKDNNEPIDTGYTLTQSDLNNAKNSVDLNITGKPYGDATVAHNGQPLSPDSTFRDIFTNLAKNDDPIKVGTIFTKHTYMMNPDGTKGQLQVTFAMVKHKAGYYTEGGDYEYIMMPYNASNDYNVNFNGMLPDTTQTDMRGKLSMCAGCHQIAAPSYIFSHP